MNDEGILKRYLKYLKLTLGIVLHENINKLLFV
jgi:hypothetical protein